MASLVLDVIAPGAGSAIHVLQAILKLCSELKEGQDVCRRTYQRLSVIMSEIDKLAEANQLPPSDALEQYHEILRDYLAFLTRYCARPLWSRVLQSKKMMAKLKDLNEDTDMLMNTLHIASAGSLMAFKQQWEVDRNEQQRALAQQAANSHNVLKEVTTEKEQVEAMTALKYALDKSQHDPETLQHAKKMLDTIVSASKIGVPTLYPWYIPEDDVEYNPQPFAGGAFGAVHRGTWGGTKVVLKTLQLDDAQMMDAAKSHFLAEINIWYKLNHPNVVRMFGASHVTSPPFIVCEDATKGTVGDYLASSDANKQKRLWRLLYDAALGLEYLHKQHVVHGDLKLNNILIGADNKAKVADFGMSLVSVETKAAPRASFSKAIGGLPWRAPEYLRQPPTYESDVYSLAMCIIEAVTGNPPYNYMSDDALRQLKEEGKIPPRPAGISDAAWALVESMTTFEPSRRCRLDEVLKTIKGFVETRDPSRRIDLTVLVQETELEIDTDRLPSSAVSSSLDADVVGSKPVPQPGFVDVRASSAPIKNTSKVLPVLQGDRPSVSSGDEGDKDAADKKKQKRRRRWKIAGFTLVLALIGAAVAATLIIVNPFSTHASTGSSPTPTPTPTPTRTATTAPAADLYQAVTVGNKGYTYVATASAIYRMSQTTFIDGEVPELYAGSPTIPGEQQGERTAARFTNITALALSSDSMRLFIADNGTKYAILALDVASSTVSVIVRSTDTAEAFGAIAAMATTPTGDLLLADYTYQRVLTLWTQNATVVKRAGHAIDPVPGLAVASNGDVYIASQCSIQRMTPEMSGFTGFAGGDACGLFDSQSDPYSAIFSRTIVGLALSASGSTMYVADAENRCIRRIDMVTKGVTIITTTAAPFRNLGGLGINAAGALYVIDTAVSGAKIVYRVYADAAPPNVTTIVNSSGMAYVGLAVAAGDGFAYVASSTAIYRLQEATASTVTPTLYAGSQSAGDALPGYRTNARFASIAALGADATRLWIAEHTTNVVRQLTFATSSVTAVLGTGQAGLEDGGAGVANVSNISAVSVDGYYTPNRLIFLDGSGTKVRFGAVDTGTVSTTAFTLTNPATAVELLANRRIAIATAKAIYVASLTNMSVLFKVGEERMSDFEATFRDGPGANARFAGIRGLARAPLSDLLYIADTANDCIRTLNLATKIVATAAGVCTQNGSSDGPTTEARLTAPTALAFTTTGDLLFLDGPDDSRRVRRLVLTEAESSATATLQLVNNTQPAVSTVWTGTSFTSAVGAPDGYIYLGDYDTIYRFRDDTIPSVDTVPAFVRGAASDPAFGIAGLAVDAADNLYVADADNDKIVRIDLTTLQVQDIAGTGATGTADGAGEDATFSSLSNIAVDGAGDLFIVDDQTVRRLVNHLDVVSTWRSMAVTAIAITPSGGVYVADKTTVYAATSDGATVHPFAGAPGAAGFADAVGTAARFNYISDMALTSNGTVLFVVDSSNHCIRRLDLVTTEVTTVAGTCTQSGSYDGSRATALLSRPKSIAITSTDSVLYVTEQSDQRLRRIDLDLE